MTSALQQAFSFTPIVTKPPRRNVVIEAGAGTGKTTAIVAAALRVLLEDEVAPDRIVLVTFTEKAAGEIADRIRHALGEIAEGDGDVSWPTGSPSPLFVPSVAAGASPAVRAAAERQLARIDALRSQTIHSFCQSLLRQFPIEAGLDPQFAIIEGFERALLHGQIYDAWIDHETRVAATPELLREWDVLAGNGVYLFQIREAVLRLIERRDLIDDPSYDCGDVAEFAPRLLDAIDTIRTTADDDSRVARYLRATAPPRRGATLEQWIDYLAPVAPDIRTEDIRRSRCKDAMWTLRWSSSSGKSAYDRLVAHRAGAAIVALARRFVRFLDDEKRKLGVVDFDDLLLRTAAVLEITAVLQRVRAQFDFIFVDEFQDTDRVQARILDLLARDANGAFVPGKTTVVGDPKQSIYGFRRADPETFDRFTKAMIDAGADRQFLDDQYRSDKPLLDAINAIFAVIFADAGDDPNVFRPAYRPLVPRRGGDDGEARITLLYPGEDDAPSRSLAEGEQIAEWIATRGGDLRQYAILLRRTTKLDDYLDALDRYDIQYVLPPTRLFLDRPAAVDLVTVLRAIGYPFDRGAEISAARSPYFALTDLEIVQQGEAWQQFLAALNAFRDASRHLTVAALIDHVIGATDIEAVYEASAENVRALRHLEHLRAIAFAYDRKIGGSVRQFVDEIAQRRRDPEEMEPSLADDASNAVRVLTVHAAKGLEFDTVILPDLSFAVKEQEVYVVDDPRSLVLNDKQFQTLSGFRLASDRELRKIGRDREEAETRRLFYVAVTRAKREVVLLPGGKKQGFAKYVDELFGAPRFPKAAGREVKTLTIGGAKVPLAFERVDPRQTGARRRRRLADPALEARLAAAAPVPLDIAPPAISIESGGTAAALQKKIGIAVHRVLERWDGTSPLDPLVTAIANEQGIDAAALRKKLASLRESTIFRRIAAAETVGREVPIRFLENGTVVERRIDRWIRENGVDIVVDYKTGRPSPAHDEQVAAYCAALARIIGRPVEGVVWYVDEC